MFCQLTNHAFGSTACGYGTSPVPPVKSKANQETGAHGHFGTTPANGTYIKYVPVGYVTSHNRWVGYLLWIIGFSGAHRFYYGRPLTGLLWFFTAGLLGVGWLIDLFLIPSMNQTANVRYRPGNLDYGVAWLFFWLIGWLGGHRFYQGKIVTGLLYLVTGGLLGLGLIYDAFTLNQQLDDLHQQQQSIWHGQPVWNFAA